MIAPEDRGFTLGDGLFETVLADAGSLRMWDAHMARLARGCEILGLPAPDPDACRAASGRALADAGLAGERAAVRLTWSSGVGGRGLDRPEAPAPALTVTAAPAPWSHGPVRLATVAVRRNDGSPASRLKSLSYLDNVLARREARGSGADEAVMLNSRGDLACAAAANLFWIEDETVFTPALGCGVLDGTIRGALIERALGEGIAVRETAAPHHHLSIASALFLTNSLVGVRAVSGLDGRGFAPHPLVERLAALVADLA